MVPNDAHLLNGTRRVEEELGWTRPLHERTSAVLSGHLRVREQRVLGAVQRVGLQRHHPLRRDAQEAQHVCTTRSQVDQKVHIGVVL
jgi:hypothetical protein